MNLEFNDGVGELPFTPVCLTQLQYIAEIRKLIRKSFAVLLVDILHFRTALTSRCSASRRVVLLSDLFWLVRIILLLKMDIKRRDWKKIDP
jgi:membrane protein CcdC involved in cytochrome C biogenesis